MPISSRFRILRLTLLATALAAPLPRSMAAGETGPSKPNILFILCDDLGYGDLGVFFQNDGAGDRKPRVTMAGTPRLDSIAKAGVQLRGHYTGAPVCAPARASLLLGVHQGHANVRDNQFDKALEDNHTLATVLGSAGSVRNSQRRASHVPRQGVDASWPSAGLKLSSPKPTCPEPATAGLINRPPTYWKARSCLSALIAFGLATSLTCPPPRDGSTSQSSLISAPAVWLAGRWLGTCVPRSSATL